MFAKNTPVLCRSLFLVVVLLLLTNMLSPVNAQSLTGEELFSACQTFERNSQGLEISMEDQLTMIMWSGFLTGFNEGATFVTGILKGAGRLRQGTYCAPSQGVSTDQLFQIILRYLKNNPKDVQQSARSAAHLALMNAFPCSR